MATIYLLEATLRGTHKVNRVMDKLQAALGGETTPGRLMLKVQGENRIIAVVSGDVEPILCTINSAADNIDIRCTPLIDYEVFGRQQLGIKDTEYENCTDKAPPFQRYQEIYWVLFKLDYEGNSLDELKTAWHAEGLAAFGLIHSGKVPVKIYKTVFTRHIHLFVQLDAVSTDAMAFGLPIMKVLGDQVQSEVRVTKLL